MKRYTKVEKMLSMRKLIDISDNIALTQLRKLIVNPAR